MVDVADQAVQLPTAQDVRADAPSSGDATASSTRKERTRPPRRQGAGTAWLVALAILAIAAIPLLLDLGRPPVTQTREARTLAESVQTWRRLAEVGVADDLLGAITPRYNAEHQLVGPPGTTWLHLLAFRLAEVPVEVIGPAELEAMVHAGRLTSAIAMLIAIGAVFWCGHCIGGVMPGFFAAAIAASTPTLIHAGRLATPDAPRVALIMLAMGGALWAIRPLKPAAPIWRQALGWLTCGLALGVATLTTGPLAIAWVGYPVLLILLLCPHRISHGLGLLAAAILAVLCVAPWAMHVHEQYPQIWSVWSHRLLPGAADADASWWELSRASAAVVLVAAMPWSLWIVAALVQPFSTSSAGSRGRMFLGWGWFLVVALLLLLTPDADVLPAALPILPIVAVLLGQLFRQYADLSAEGRHARLWRALPWPQLGLLFAASIGLPVVLGMQARLTEQGFLPGELVRPMHWTYWAGAGALLLTLMFFSLRFAVRQYPGWTVVCWAGWTVAATALLVVPVTRGELLRSPAVEEAKRIAQAAAGEPVYALNVEPTPLTLLHAARPIPVIDDSQLAALREAGQSVTLLTSLDAAAEPGLVPVDDLPALGRMLWRLPAAPLAPATMPAAD